MLDTSPGSGILPLSPGSAIPPASPRSGILAAFSGCGLWPVSPLGRESRPFLYFTSSFLIQPDCRFSAISVGHPEPDPDTQDPHVFGPPGSGSRSISQRYKSGPFPFLINVLSGLKKCLQNNILTQNCSKKFNFLD
jgi:hypothetical protein